MKRLLIVSLALSCAGCALRGEDPATEAAKPAMRAMGQPVTVEAAPSDESIGLEIRRRLDANPAETAGIVVEVDGGTVILRGAAPSIAAAWRAEAAARSVQGVKEVRNQILVGSGLR